MVKNVIRNPNSSRIRSDNPLPVIAPMRGGHLLDDDQGDSRRHQSPKQRVSVFGPGLRVRQNPARIVVDVRRDKSRPDHREERHKTVAEESPALARSVSRLN